MNALKCCYTIFTSAKNDRGKRYDIKLEHDNIPYNKNPVFLGVIFDESLCFNKHFVGLRARGIKRLNIIKIFSHRSWYISKQTLIQIYRSLIGSIFDYSFFTIANVSTTNLKSVQRVQNRAIRCIFKLDWDSPSKDLGKISGLLTIYQRFYQLGGRYLVKNLYRGSNLLLDALLINYNKRVNKKNYFKTLLCRFIFLIKVFLTINCKLYVNQDLD